ncbi:hypothetical protein ACNJYG_12700, partial [Pseudomonas sp. GW6]
GVHLNQVDTIAFGVGARKVCWPDGYEEGSKNVYADLGCTDADVMQRKASKRSAKPPSELLH